MSSDQIQFFSSYAPDFQELSGNQDISYPNQVLPLLIMCTSSFASAAAEDPQQVGEAARSIFLAVHDIFLRMGGTLRENEQKVLLSFALRVITRIPHLPDDVLKGLETTAIITSLAMEQLSDRVPPKNSEELNWELRYVLIPLAAELSRLDFQKVPFTQVIELHRHFMALVIRHVAICDDDVFAFFGRAIEKIVSKISSFPGGTTCVIGFWEELLTAIADALDEDLDSKEHLETIQSIRSRFAPEAGLSQDQQNQEERIDKAVLLAAGLTSQPVLARLMKITTMIGNYIFQAHAYLAGEEPAHAQNIFNALDRITATSRKMHSAQGGWEKIADLRKDALSGFCGIYPALLIERYAGQEADPFFVPTPKEILQKTAVGLRQADPEFFPPEQFHAHYAGALDYALSHHEEITLADFEQSLEWLQEAGDRRHSALPVDHISAMWTEIANMIRGYPPSSAKGLQNLFALLSGSLRWMKAHEERISLEETEALLEAASVLDGAVVACANGGKKKTVREFRDRIVAELVEAYPTFLLDCFDKNPNPCPMPLMRALEATFSELGRMESGKAAASYASDQLTKTLAFIMHHLEEMKAEEVGFCKKRFIKARERWASHAEVVADYTRVWAEQIHLKSLPPAPSDGALPQTPCACLERAVDFLVYDLNFIPKKTARSQQMAEVLRQLALVAGELASGPQPSLSDKLSVALKRIS